MKRYILLSLGLFAFFLVYYFPAQLAWPLLQKQGVDLVSLSGLSGSWHSGAARSAQIMGASVADLSWRLRPVPWAPLRGELAASLGEGFFRGQGQAGWRGLKGRVSVTALRAELPLEYFAAHLDRQGLAADGVLELWLPRLEWAGGTPRRAEGEVRLRDFKALQPLPLVLGDFRAGISSNPEGIRVVLRDEQAHLVVDGLLLLEPEGEYHFTAALTPRDPQDRELAMVLSFLGAPDRDGAIRLDKRGADFKLLLN